MPGIEFIPHVCKTMLQLMEISLLPISVFFKKNIPFFFFAVLNGILALKEFANFDSGAHVGLPFQVKVSAYP